MYLWQFNLFAQFKCQMLFDLEIGSYQVLTLRTRMDLRVIAIKEYSTFLKVPELEPHYPVV